MCYKKEHCLGSIREDISEEMGFKPTVEISNEEVAMRMDFG